MWPVCTLSPGEPKERREEEPNPKLDPSTECGACRAAPRPEEKPALAALVAAVLALAEFGGDKLFDRLEGGPGLGPRLEGGGARALGGVADADLCSGMGWGEAWGRVGRGGLGWGVGGVGWVGGGIVCGGMGWIMMILM